MSTAAIIGASRGIGLELVRQYAAAGWRVHATTRTPHSPGDLGDVPGEVILHGLDVSERKQITDLAEALSNESLDVLIHNAGVKDNGYSRNEVMAINSEAPIHVAEALLDAVGRASGRIALMSSQLGARRGASGSLGDYGDSKAALNDAFRARADAWAARGIRAVVMHPGWVRTDMGGRSAPVSVSESAEGIRRVLASLSAEQHGSFLTWRGEKHPW